MTCEKELIGRLPSNRETSQKGEEAYGEKRKRKEEHRGNKKIIMNDYIICMCIYSLSRLDSRKQWKGKNCRNVHKNHWNSEHSSNTRHILLLTM